MKTVAAYVLGIVTLPVLAVIGAFLGLFPSKATPTPPKWELAIAGRALDSSLEHRSKGLRSPLANKQEPSSDADSLFDKECSSCHGTEERPSGLTFYPRAPQFFHQRESDLEPAEAYAAIRDGIRYSAMPAWSRQLSDGEMWKLAEFVAKAGEHQPTKSGSHDED